MLAKILFKKKNRKCRGGQGCILCQTKTIIIQMLAMFNLCACGGASVSDGQFFP